MARATEMLPALKSRGLPRLAASELFVAEGGMPAELAEYFAQFVPPGPCIGCGATLGARDEIEALSSRFRWGLVHGEGYCGGCGYPARAYHRDVGPLRFLLLVLQYHPDVLEPTP